MYVKTSGFTISCIFEWVSYGHNICSCTTTPTVFKKFIERLLNLLLSASETEIESHNLRSISNTEKDESWSKKTHFYDGLDVNIWTRRFDLRKDYLLLFFTREQTKPQSVSL